MPVLLSTGPLGRWLKKLISHNITAHAAPDRQFIFVLILKAYFWRHASCHKQEHVALLLQITSRSNETQTLAVFAPARVPPALLSSRLEGGRWSQEGRRLIENEMRVSLSGRAQPVWTTGLKCSR